MKFKEKLKILMKILKRGNIEAVIILPLYLLSKIEMKIRENLAIKKIKSGKVDKVKLLNGKYLKISDIDLGLSIDLLLDKNHIRENTATKKLLNFLDRYTKRNGKIKELIDVGANIGFFTILLSDYFKKILSIEPIPECIKVLKESIKINKLKNKVKIINAAVGSQDRYIKMKREKYLNTSKVDKSGNLKVKMIDINKVLTNNCLLKMDIEGYEYEIIKHMNIFPKFIYLELHVNLLGKRKAKEILNILSKHKYKIIFAVRKEEMWYNRVLLTKAIVKRTQELLENFKLGEIPKMKNKSPLELSKVIKNSSLPYYKYTPIVINMLLGK